MLRTHAGPLTGLAGALSLLGVLTTWTGLGGLGWVVGVACACAVTAVLARGCARQQQTAPGCALGPAGRVTLTRAVLSCGLAAMVADSAVRETSVGVLVAIAVVALVLDAVDGWVARVTGTASAFGARFDMEVDAFLVLVLSVYVARSSGWWVLAIGMARYVFLAVQRVLPRLQGTLPPRRWFKAVAATQGVVLVVAAAEVLPEAFTTAALAVALALLVDSFRRETVGLWRLADAEPDERAERSVAGVVTDA